MRQTEQALCYWPRTGAPEAAAARRALAAMKVRVRPAGPEDTGRTIGALFAGKGEEPAPPGEPVPDPILVLSGFTSARLQALLLALQRHDAVQHTEYMKTLRVYLDQNLNAMQTAKELFIHRSTFLYRMEKIGEIVDLDLNDYDTLLYVMMTFRILEQDGEDRRHEEQ